MRRLLIALPISALFLAACSSDEPSDGASGTDDAQPRSVAAAEKVAQEQADRYAAGDFGGAWDLWAEDAQDTISREDYIELGEACLGAGVKIEVTDARLEGDDRAVVRLGVGRFQQAYTVLYEDGAWRWVPTDEALEDYDGDVDRLIKTMEAKGNCVPD
jgi:hypothetical protein